MRAQSSLGQSIPVTTRHLESLIRLAQARTRLELRSHVTAKDAQDVVDLLHESLLDAFTSDSGVIDMDRRGGQGLAKQVKALIKQLTIEAAGQRGSVIFTFKEIAEVCVRMRLTREPESLVEVMHTECYLLLKGPKLYQLQTA